MKILFSDAGRVQDGFENEDNDCTVRAAVVRFTMPYFKAHALLMKHGRPYRGGPKFKQVRAFLEEMGLVVTRFMFKFEQPTVARFVREHPKGRFYCVVRGHAFGVNDGMIIDETPPRPRQKILMYA